MPAGARPHKITERCLAYSPGARKPWQCKHCDRIFRTKNAALSHQCRGELSSGLMERRASRRASPRMRIVAPDPNSPHANEASRDER